VDISRGPKRKKNSIILLSRNEGEIKHIVTEGGGRGKGTELPNIPLSMIENVAFGGVRREGREIWIWSGCLPRAGLLKGVEGRVGDSRKKGRRFRSITVAEEDEIVVGQLLLGEGKGKETVSVRPWCGEEGKEHSCRLPVRRGTQALSSGLGGKEIGTSVIRKEK